MGKLFAVVVTIITLVATAIFVAHVWWPPADIAVHGPAIDHQLRETMVSAGLLFVVLQLAPALFFWQYGRMGENTSGLQSLAYLVYRLLLVKKKDALQNGLTRVYSS